MWICQMSEFRVSKATRRTPGNQRLGSPRYIEKGVNGCENLRHCLSPRGLETSD